MRYFYNFILYLFSTVVSGGSFIVNIGLTYRTNKLLHQKYTLASYFVIIVKLIKYLTNVQAVKKLEKKRTELTCKKIKNIINTFIVNTRNTVKSHQ